MRISDWSSDVCSSDLGDAVAARRHGGLCDLPERSDDHDREARRGAAQISADAHRTMARTPAQHAPDVGAAAARRHRPTAGDAGAAARKSRRRQRSEEHTSELQSLMRISYAVFCLKKKTTN